MECKTLKEIMERDYICWGMLPPEGMVEEYEKKSGGDFIPSNYAIVMYNLINKNKYELRNN